LEELVHEDHELDVPALEPGQGWNLEVPPDRRAREGFGWRAARFRSDEIPVATTD
jgi:hypothetical protein